MKAHAERAILDEMFEKRSERWPEDTPDTKEAYFIRDLFDGELFGAFRGLCRPHCFTGLFHSETAAKTAVRCA